MAGVALQRSPPEHLLEEDAGLHGPQEDDELERRDVDARREHVDGHDDAGVRAVAELADPLQGPVGDVPGDLLDEGVPAPEHLAAQLDELLGVARVGQVIDGEDERLREVPRDALVVGETFIGRHPPMVTREECV